MNGLGIGHTTPPLRPGNGYQGTQCWQRVRVLLNMWTDCTGILRNKEKQIHTHIEAQLENMMSLILQSEDSVRSCQ